MNATRQAVSAFEWLRWFMCSVPALATESVDLSHDVTTLAICGEHGRVVARRGLCPKCDGFVMTLQEVEILKHGGWKQYVASRTGRAPEFVKGGGAIEEIHRDSTDGTTA